MMKPFIRRVLFGVVCCTGCLFAPGCVSQKTIDTLDARLKSLESKGTPDSILSSVRVYLTEAKAGKQRGNSMVVKASVDSVKKYLPRAELWYETSLRATRPRVDSLIAFFTKQKTQLSGLQLKQADSLLDAAQFYVKQKWYIQAKGLVERLDSLLPTLLSDETSAGKAGASIVGTWTMSKTHDAEEGVNAVEKKKVSFMKDGTFSMAESMKGQTTPARKEDWEFQSKGNYAIKGDTILLAVTHEKCLRQTYWNYVNKKGVLSWVKNEVKPYEKDITNGSKDQYFTFSYLKENFKK
jgi:hypothetical protein